MLKLFFSFHGRLARSRYWLVMLTWLMIRIGIPYVWFWYDSYSLTSLGIEDVTANPDIWEETSQLYFVLTLISAVSMISASVRRLHDISASGLWALMHFVPGLEFLFIFIIGSISSSRGTNEYGLNPHGENNFYIPGANEEMRVRELQILSQLFEKGQLTQEEFQKAKDKLLKG